VLAICTVFAVHLVHLVHLTDETLTAAMSSNNGFAGRLQRPEMSHNSVPLFQHADDITPAESQGVTPRTSRLENPFATPEDSASSQGDIRSSVMESGAAAVTTMPVDPRYDAEEELKRAGKTRVARQKIIFVLVLLCLKYGLHVIIGFYIHLLFIANVVPLFSEHGGGPSIGTCSCP